MQLRLYLSSIGHKGEESSLSLEPSAYFAGHEKPLTVVSVLATFCNFKMCFWI